MSEARSKSAFKVKFVEQGGPSTVFPVRLTTQELRVVVEVSLEVGSVWPIELEHQSGEVCALDVRTLWCKRVYDCLWEIGFDYIDGLVPEHFVSQEPGSDSEQFPQSLEQGGIRLQDISHEELSRLAVLARICEVFNSSVSIPEIMRKAMEILLDSTGAQRCLLLLDRGHDTMEIPAAVGAASLVNKRYSRTVVDEVRRTGRPVISKDVDGDSRFQDAESLKSLGVRSILCVPVRSEEQDFGLIYLDNAVKAGVFTEKEMQLSVVIAGLAASALGRAEVFSQMIQGEKMAALGTMLTGTIHELNNPLTAILCLSEMIHQEGDELTESLIKEARRCRNMVNQLLQTARTGSHTQAELVSLEEVVEHALRVVKREMEVDSIELRYSEPNTLSSIRGNSDRLAQILLNLLFNAIHELKNRSGAILEIRLYERLEKIYLVVADNGRGVPAEFLSKIFDPFFTTKPAGEGTGMGLAVTHRLVKEHGGSITFENRAEGGAMFTVSFPVASRDPKEQLSDVAG